MQACPCLELFACLPSPITFFPHMAWRGRHGHARPHPILQALHLPIPAPPFLLLSGFGGTVTSPSLSDVTYRAAPAPGA